MAMIRKEARVPETYMLLAIQLQLMQLCKEHNGTLVLNKHKSAEKTNKQTYNQTNKNKRHVLPGQPGVH